MVKRHYKVIWDDEAKASLRRIYNYIKKRESREQAARVRSEIKKEGDSLGFIPHKYANDPFMEKDPRDIHYRVIWSYRIIYQVTGENIAILDVIHTSQSPENMRLVR